VEPHPHTTEKFPKWDTIHTLTRGEVICSNSQLPRTTTSPHNQMSWPFWGDNSSEESLDLCMSDKFPAINFNFTTNSFVGHAETPMSSSAEEYSPPVMRTPQGSVQLLGVRTQRPPAEETEGGQRTSKRAKKAAIDDYRIRRAKVACVHCRRSKLRCDNGRPCSRCVSSGRAEACRNSLILESLSVTPESASTYESYLEELLGSIDIEKILDLIVDKPLKL
jgi:hypothetical protein